MRDKLIFALSIIWVIALSVTLTIFLAIPLFGLEIHWYNLAEVAGMSASTVWHNFLVLMSYMINPFVAHLNMPNFPSSADGLQHFAEVRQLFMVAIGLTIVLIPAFVLFLKDNLQILFHNGLRVVMGLPIAIGLVTTVIGFDSFFIYFHEAIFNNDTWLFDPATDPIINVLPEQYFMHCFLLFLLVYELIFFFIYRRGHGRRPKKVRQS